MWAELSINIINKNMNDIPEKKPTMPCYMAHTSCFNITSFSNLNCAEWGTKKRTPVMHRNKSSQSFTWCLFCLLPFDYGFFSSLFHLLLLFGVWCENSRFMIPHEIIFIRQTYRHHNADTVSLWWGNDEILFQRF